MVTVTESAGESETVLDGSLVGTDVACTLFFRSAAASFLPFCSCLYATQKKPYQ